LGILLLPGCNSRPASPDIARDEASLAQVTASEVSGLLVNQVYLTEEDMNRLGDYVDRHLKRGELREIASLVNVPGPWHDTPWYRTLCKVFACGLSVGHPFKCDGAEDALRALHDLAISSDTSYRDTAVYAAEAIRFDYPDEAKTVLLREYARGSVSRGVVWGCSASCGRTLQKMNVLVPKEIVFADEVADAMRRVGAPIGTDLAEWEGFDDETRERLEQAATAFNGLLREALDKGNMELLASLVRPRLRDAKIAEMYRMTLERAGKPSSPLKQS